jgi:hypothetical protein
LFHGGLLTFLHDPLEILLWPDGTFAGLVEHMNELAIHPTHVINLAHD